MHVMKVKMSMANKLSVHMVTLLPSRVIIMPLSAVLFLPSLKNLSEGINNN